MPPSALGSKDEDRMDKQTSRLLIFLGKQIIRGTWQMLTFSVMGGEGKTNFEISGFQRLGVSILGGILSVKEFQQRARVGCSESKDG